MNPVETFQHYQLLRREDGTMWELGRGSMGITYKAFDVNLQCDVALKVINKMFLNSEVARSRFIREARAAAALRHRNVASVYHLSSDGDQFFYAMEFIDGETVEAWVRRAGPLPAEIALRVAIQAVRALGAAAKQKLVHRDIKPANLMVCREDEDEGSFVVKLIDFGLARTLLDADSINRPSSTFGGFVGTPIYASPEQLEEKDLDTRSDIYSLGVTLWFTLAGRPPFTGTISDIFTKHLTQEPPWEQLAGMPEPVTALLAKMLQKRPALRPQSPAELRAELTACLRAVVLAIPGAAAALEADDEDLAPISIAVGGGAVGTTGSGTDAGGGAAPAVIPPTPAPGTLLSDRFRLTQLVGEGLGGQVWQAHDLQAGSRPVAVKIFHPELIITPEDHERLQENVAAIEAAPHPHLLKIVALDHHLYFTYLAVEWVDGFTLVDLLRKRGTLTVAECLRLLKQLAAATDHARAHGLAGLELDLHQILVGFPGGLPACDPAGETSILRAPLTEWPEFELKIDALGAGREASTLATWAGEITLVSTGPRWLRHDTQLGLSAGGDAEDKTAVPRGVNAYTSGLGALVYEFLNGNTSAPPARSSFDLVVPAVGSDGRGALDPGTRSPFALPILGDAGNAVLRRCFVSSSSSSSSSGDASAGAGFSSDMEFFAALARATGFDSETLRPFGLLATHEWDDAAPDGRGRAGAAAVDLAPAAAGAIRSQGRSLVEERFAESETEMGDSRRRLAFHLGGIWSVVRRATGSAWSELLARVPREFRQRRKLAWSLGVGGGLIGLSFFVWFLNPRSHEMAKLPPAATAGAGAVPVEKKGPVETSKFTAEDQRLLTQEIARKDTDSATGTLPLRSEPDRALPPLGNATAGTGLIPPAAAVPPATASPAAAESSAESPTPEASPTPRKRARSRTRQREQAPPPNFLQRMFGIKPKPKSK